MHLPDKIEDACWLWGQKFKLKTEICLHPLNYIVKITSQLTLSSPEFRSSLLLEALSGSRAYGLATEASDTDLRGVFIAPLNQLLGYDLYQPQIQDARHDEVYFELGRFIELLGKNNPAALELLASPEDCVRYRHPLMAELQPRTFLSRLCGETFGQYALSQVKKARGLNKKITLPAPPRRPSVLDCCHVTVGGGSRPLQDWLAEHGLDQRYCGLVRLAHMPRLYALYHDARGQQAGRPWLDYQGIVRDQASACDVALSSVPADQPVLTYLSFHADAFKKACREFSDYQNWLQHRNPQRYQAAEAGSYDGKNLMHTFRLLSMAEEIARYAEIRVRRPDRERLLEIRRGQADYAGLVAEAETRIETIRQLFAHSGLPARPDEGQLQSLLIALRHRFYALT